MHRPARTAHRKTPGHPGRRSLWCVAAFVLWAFFSPACAVAADWTPLTDRLIADGFTRATIEALFSRPEVLYEPDAMAGKIRELLRSRALEPTELAALRTVVRKDVLDRRLIARASAYLRENGTVLAEARRLYEVPQEVVVSILLIETRLGKNTGSRRVFNRLASMARSVEIEFVRPSLGAELITPENEEFARRRCREKADWAYEELSALLRYALPANLDPLEIRGSLYGAIGLCQFMPSNLFIYGVDGDGDGRIDPFTLPDAVHSIANYLKQHGWRRDLDREGQHRVIFDYNHSTIYANTVLAAAQRIKESLDNH